MWDGMYLKVDHEDNRWLYTTTQFGAHQRVDQLKGERRNIQPVAGEGKPPYRYTWNTPLLVSPHNSRIIYTGGQMLLRSVDRGDTWQEISPDLTRNDSVKIAGRGHIMYCTISAISESPLTPGILWVGTDDGKVWISRNHGAAWTDLSGNLIEAGAPDERYVSRIFASHHQEGRGYLVKSGFRNDDFKPCIYRSDDFGSSWQCISQSLPQQPVSAFWEDDINPDLLFAGNDSGVWFTLDGGESWIPLKNNMPNVPVKDILVHPLERDLVVGTYGRGIWVADIYPFRELSREILDEEFYLFDIESRPKQNFSQQVWWGNHGPFQDNLYRTPNEENGLHIYYCLGSPSSQPVRIVISDPGGKVVKELEGSRDPGIHKVVWNTMEAAPGEYQVSLIKGKKEIRKTGRVLERMTWAAGNRNFH
jgi:hypothetical protein